MKIVVVGICGALNSGDHAQLNSVLKVLRECFPEAQVACVHRNTQLHKRIYPDVDWLEQIGTSNIMHPLFRRAINMRNLFPALLRAPWLLPERQAETVAALRNCDLMVACPGGYLEDGGPHILTHLLHFSLAKKAVKFFAPQSIGPFRRRWVRTLCQGSLAAAHAICVRERMSALYVQNEMHLPRKLVHHFPDMAFYERSVDAQATEKVLRELQVSEQESIAATTLWPSMSAGVSEAVYLSALAGAAQHLGERGIRTVVVRQAWNAEGVSGDLEILTRAQKYFPKASVFCKSYLPPDVLRGIFKKATVVFGTRMHGNIFALCQCTPTVAISYHQKTQGIMELFKMENLVVPIRDVSAERLISVLNTALVNAVSIRETLSQAVSHFAQSRDRLKELLSRTYKDAQSSSFRYPNSQPLPFGSPRSGSE